jgi:hypothetical protein
MIGPRTAGYRGDIMAALDQSVDDSAADKAGGSSHEHAHRAQRYPDRSVSRWRQASSRHAPAAGAIGSLVSNRSTLRCSNGMPAVR